jgi:hypothetical protein
MTGLQVQCLPWSSPRLANWTRNKIFHWKSQLNSTALYFNRPAEWIIRSGQLAGPLKGLFYQIRLEWMCIRFNRLNLIPESLYDVFCYSLICCWLRDQNTWNTFPVSEWCTISKIIGHNQLLNSYYQKCVNTVQGTKQYIQYIVSWTIFLVIIKRE